MTTQDKDLRRAYGLKTPEDSVKLYRDWAETYDTDFADRMDYLAPQVVAEIYTDFATPADQPVLDVGAGTGLVGARLFDLSGLSGRDDWQLDGLDISHEMLDVALAKGCYRNGLQADLTQKLTIPDATYGGIVSAGTFTHGHVGPGALDELMRISRPGALFVLGVNSQYFAALGFEKKMASLAAKITKYELLERVTYGENANTGHRSDTSQVMVFRKS